MSNRDHMMNALKLSSSLYATGGFVLSLAAALMVPVVASANPTDGVVVAGSATISSVPNQLQIHQNSDRVAIDWSSFNINAGESTRFFQPSASSIALNRVVNSNQVSAINGSLIANGRVVLINPNGIIIGKTGTIDTASFIATSADISNHSFMNSSTLQFNRAGNLDAVVENAGRITVAEEGLAGLVAPTVRNSGIVEARLAKVQMAAADTFALDFYGDGLIQFVVDAPAKGKTRTLTSENTGSIIADGGKVLMTAAQASDVVHSVINTSGQVRARGLVNRGGEIVLTGAGAKVRVSGKLDASGVKNGGSIKIGGDYQGQGSVAKASETTIEKGTQITANAGEYGNAGNIIVWSEDFTAAHGDFFAQGGSISGNGGLVETSSKGVLNVDGLTVNTLATNGNAGTWLLDPDNIRVRNSGASYVGLPATGTSNVDVATINGALSNVVLLANDTITFETDVNIRTSGVGLSAIAGVAGNTVGQRIQSSYIDGSNNTVNVSLRSGVGNINMNNNYIRTNGGSLHFVSGNEINIGNSTLFTRGGNISLTSGDIAFGNNDVATAGGNVRIRAIDANNTSGEISTNSTTINTSSASAASIGGITLLENGSSRTSSQYGNSNTMRQNANGGSIYISGDDSIGGNSVCFAAGGTGCSVSDPVPVTNLTITANAQTKNYGDLDPILTWALTGTLATGDSITGALTRAAGQNVGTYAILQGTLAALSGAGNYNLTYVGANLTINPYLLSIIANAQTKTYGDADPALTYTAGALRNGDTASVFSGSLTRAAGENVGGYAINQGTLSAGSNYTLAYTGNTLSISPYLLSIAANANTKVYGDADPAFTYTSGALRNGDTASVFSGALTRNAGENVGYYVINQGSLSAGSNYTISYAGENLQITPYTLAVSADAQTKAYGDIDPTLTYSYAALRNGDTASVFSGALNRVAGENVGDYRIRRGTLSAGSNYIIDYTRNNLSITPYILSVTANAQSKVYGDVDPSLTYTYAALRNGDTDSVFSGALNRDAGENVGGYAINQNTLSAGSNYTIAYTGDNLSITPYTLAVAADAQSKVYGDVDPTLTYTYAALRNGDDASVFTGGLRRVAGENVGDYRIRKGTLSAGGNYIIDYTNNDLSITPYTLSVAADAQSKVYGDIDPTLTYTYAALRNGDDASVFTGGLRRVAGENVGDYRIRKGTLSAGGNYIIDYTNNDLTITPYTLAVSADRQRKIYGDVDPSLTYTFAALRNGDDASVFSGDLERVAGEDVGRYRINQGTLSAGSNYVIDYTGSRLRITPYRLAITADAQTKVYGDVDPSLTYTYAALRNGDTASVFSGALDRVLGENVGDYAIGQGTVSAGRNYRISYTGDNLSITPYSLLVTADAQNKTFGSSDPTLTYTYGALRNGDDASVFIGGLFRDSGEGVGSYSINRGKLYAGDNYTINYVGNFLTISAPRPPVPPTEGGGDIPTSGGGSPTSGGGSIPSGLTTSTQTPDTFNLVLFDSLDRPVVSIANQSNVQNIFFEPFDFSGTRTNVNLRSGNNNANNFANLALAAGGQSPQDLANLAPAAGGSNIVKPKKKTDNKDTAAIECANSFFENKPCGSTGTDI